MMRWVGLVCVLIVVTGAATFAFQMLLEPVPEPTLELHGRSDGSPPRLEVVGTTFHEFGTMAAKVKGSHSWKFKNVGEVPLDVWLQETTCACTVATLKTDTGEPQKTITIAPGKSNMIEVSWEAKKAGRFGQAATLGTTDPDNTTVTLTILGIMLAPVEVQPAAAVDFPEISNEETHRATLTVVSPDRANLKLTGLATSKPGLIVAEAKPMTADEVARKRVKSGFNLTVEVKPGMPLGRFSEELVIETDHPDQSSVKVAITGRAVGPISAVPARLLMSSVPSRRGGTQELTLVVRGERETHFEVASKPEKVQVSIDREEKPGTKGRYRLRVVVPPNTTPGVLDDPIILKTDHPRVSEVRIPVSIYVSSRSDAGAPRTDFPPAPVSRGPDPRNSD